VGDNTITVNYGGDPTYLDATATTKVTASQSQYSMSAQTGGSVKAGISISDVVTVTTANNYTGTVNVTCALTTSPAGASHLPTCAADGSSQAVLMNNVNVGYVDLFVHSTANTAAQVEPDTGIWRTTGAVSLCCLLLFGIPARRRRWRALLGCVLLAVALTAISACGGGGTQTTGSGGGGNPPPSNGTTPGAYTFTVTGTGDPAVTPAPTTTFTVTIQ
jgi:hypothetical protein